MTADKNIQYQDNSAASDERYICVRVQSDAIIKSWRESMFSFQWLDNDGKIKAVDNLPDSEQQRRREVEGAVQHGRSVEKPVLGIGLQDNVEIGSGKAVFLTLSALGYEAIEVHIPKSNEKEFSKFIVK